MKRADLLASLDIGASIKKLREQKGLSQEELAKDICDRTNITKLENGYSKIPSLSFILLICEKLEITIEEFLNFAMSNSYTLNHKYILNLLMNNDIVELEKHLSNIKYSSLSIKDQIYFDYLNAKIKLNNNNIKGSKNDLKKLIESNNIPLIIKLLSMHELVKTEKFSIDNNLYKLENISILNSKSTPDEFLYFINDLFNITIKDSQYNNYSKSLLDIEIQFINSHNLHKYIDYYYKNKIKLIKDDIVKVKDLERKILSINKYVR